MSQNNISPAEKRWEGKTDQKYLRGNEPWAKTKAPKKKTKKFKQMDTTTRKKNKSYSAQADEKGHTYKRVAAVPARMNY